MKNRIARALVAPLVVGSTATCLGSLPARELPPPVQVTVTNDLGRGIAAIFVIPEFGTPRLIGSVESPDQLTLTYDWPTVAERMRLRAVVPGAGELVSDSFIVPSNARAVWTLRNNRVTTPSNRMWRSAWR